jgi:hypothetical protein
MPQERSNVPSDVQPSLSGPTYYATQRELEEEWDIERAIEANASVLAFAGVALGATADRRWLILPAMVTAFLFQHAIQGWCPPVPVLRRTAFEIEQERNVLKAIPGGL